MTDKRTSGTTTLIIAAHPLHLRYLIILITWRQWLEMSLRSWKVGKWATSYLEYLIDCTFYYECQPIGLVLGYTT